MQMRHDFNVLAMEPRLPCIKPTKLYVNSSRVWEHIGIGWGYTVKPSAENMIMFCFLVLQHFLTR